MVIQNKHAILSNILPPSLSGYSSFSSAFGLAVSQVVLWLLMPNRFSFYSFQKFLNGRSIPGQSFLPSSFIRQRRAFEGEKACWLDSVQYALSKYFFICHLSRTCNPFMCQQFYFIKASLMKAFTLVCSKIG